MSVSLAHHNPASVRDTTLVRPYSLSQRVHRLQHSGVERQHRIIPRPIQKGVCLDKGVQFIPRCGQGNRGSIHRLQPSKATLSTRILEPIRILIKDGSKGGLEVNLMTMNQRTIYWNRPKMSPKNGVQITSLSHLRIQR